MTWIYLVEYKVTPGISGLSWVRLGQFAEQPNAVKQAEKWRKNSTKDTRKSSYRVVPVKLMDGME